MNKEKYLLNCLQEECAEVSQRASKAIRFGLLEKEPGQYKDNEERLREEVLDLLGVIKYINNKFPSIIVNFDIDKYDHEGIKHIDNKMKKITKYMEYSRSIGELDD